MKKYFVPILALILCLGMGLTFAQVAEVKAPSYALAEETTVSSAISVYGEAEKEVTPDIAKINVTIENIDMDTKIAKDSTFTTFEAAQKKLDEIGIAKDQIVVESFSSYPNYDYTCGRKLSGYYATLNFSFQTKDMNIVKSVIDGLTEVGVTRINNVNYSISNENEVYNEVLIEALENAQIKAKKLLGRENLTLVKMNEENVYNCSNLMRSYSEGFAKQDMVGKVMIKAKVNAQYN